MIKPMQGSNALPVQWLGVDAAGDRPSAPCVGMAQPKPILGLKRRNVCECLA